MVKPEDMQASLNKCASILEELQQCYNAAWYNRWFARCTHLRLKSDKCLHDQRMERARKNRIEAKERHERYLQRKASREAFLEQGVYSVDGEGKRWV